MKNFKFIFMIACMTAFGLAGNEKYAIDSLNKVKFEKNEKHADIELVKDGRLQFVIVADLAADRSGKLVPSGKALGKNRESARIAVNILKNAFERTTGKTPAVLPPDSPELVKYPYKILVGKSSLTDKLGIQIETLPKEGFKVKTFPGGIAIAGHDGNRIPGFYHDLDLGINTNNGTVNGVYDFIERFLGMRFYYPGLGVYAPEVKNLSISSVAYLDGPKYFTRTLGRLNGRFHKKGGKAVALGSRQTTKVWPWDDIPFDDTDFNAAYRAVRNSRFVCSESPHPFKMAKAFPDKIETMFARDRKGKLHYSSTVYTDNYFDVSNPRFVKLMAESYKKFYDTNGRWSPIWDWYHPTPEYMCYGPVDTHKIIDNDYTKKYTRRNPDKSSVMSEINSNFYLALAREVERLLPGKKLAVMAYANYLYPPETVDKFPDNLRVMVCVGTPVYIRHQGYHSFFREMYAGWNAKTAGKAVPYPYDPSYQEEGGISHAIRGWFEGEFLKEMRPYISEDEAFICAHFNWDYYYSPYLIARAYWNPDFNAEAALDEHWRLFFGEESAKYLKTFYRLVIDRWVHHYLPKLKVDRRSIPGINYDILYKEAFPATVGNELKSLLVSAEKALPPGKDAKRRFYFFAMPWEKILGQLFAYQKLKVPQYSIKYVPDDSIAIDGRLEETAWRKAAKMPMKTAFYGEDKKGMIYPEVRMLWNKKGVYIALKSPAPYKKTGKLWGEDNVEFFISPGINKNSVFQFVISSSGFYEDYFMSFDPPRPPDNLWNCKGVKTAVSDSKDFWSAELFIPFTALDDSQVPIPGDYWFGNVVSNRSDCGPAAFSPTLGNNRNISTYSRFYFAGNCE